MEDGRWIPDDFGLDALGTLSHVGDPTPAVEHAPYWNRWLKSVQADPRPVLVARDARGRGIAEIDPSDPTAGHAFMSLGGVRIGCRLLMPPRERSIRCGIVVCHGYEVIGRLSDRDPVHAARRERGAVVLHVRVRGYPGSRLDMAGVGSGPGPLQGWITGGLDEADEGPNGFLKWIYAQATADVFNACRALRWWLNEHAGPLTPLYLCGESFGGGLAVAAAAKLVGRPDSITEIDRLVIGLPSMGEWPWRHAQHDAGRGSGGMGAEVARLLDERPDQSELIRARLRVADSVVLASRVRCPVLCKLAERDEVVPAPSAAAVFNALGVDPGRKWRFVVPHGHAETGLHNARRHAAFARLADAFLDPDRRPDEVMQSPLPAGEPEPPGPAVAPPAETLFGDDADPLSADADLIAAYQRVGRTLDDLPYTNDFEQLYTSVAKAVNLDRRGTLQRLFTMRKAGRLPKLGRAATSPPRLEPIEEHRLEAMVIETVGALGQRDRLLYTPAFEDLVARFNAEHGRDLSPHDVWRVVAKLAK